MKNFPKEATQIIPPTTNVLGRTFFVKDEEYGTGVVIDFDEKLYLITASHLLSTPYDGQLKMKTSEKWEDFFSHKLIARNIRHDIAVLELNYDETVYQAFSNLPLPLNSAGLVLGQHVHFLGFPFKMTQHVNFEHFENRPYPMTKGAILSMISEGELILDGMNNIGFSGGPIVFYYEGRQNVCGIVTRYKEEMREVNMSDEDWEKELKAIYRENTGIMYGCDATIIRNMIAESPKQN